ncbi:MAG: hypothetical protein ACI97A_002489 [Planctomycetota bacterium]|jgi:hypothetical protein
MSSDRPSRRAVPIGEILDAYIAETERTSVKPLAVTKRAWESIAKARHIKGTRIASLKEGKVIIEVKSPPLVAELAQFRRRELLDALQRETRAETQIKDLRFRLSAW